MSIRKKASHLTTERAPLGEGRQIFERSQPHSRSKLWLSAAVVMLISTSLPALSADWSAFVSKTETIKFIAPVACDAWLWWTPPARHLAAYDVKPLVGDPGSFSAYYYPDRVMKLDYFHVREHWSSGRPLDLTAENRRKYPCAVFAELPTKDGFRPFYVPPLDAKQAELQAAIAGAITKALCILLILLPGAILCRYGYERVQPYGIAVCFAVTIAIASIVFAEVTIHDPWTLYEQARAYRHYFESLPREGGALLPISRAQFMYLQAGPPHPDQMLITSEPLWLLIGASMLWLVVVLPAIWRGIYWLAVPLPLEALHQQALRRGRQPSAEEIHAAMLGACTGKAAWQHRIMQRKADAFAKNLNNIAQHL